MIMNTGVHIQIILTPTVNTERTEEEDVSQNLHKYFGRLYALFSICNQKIYIQYTLLDP